MNQSVATVGKGPLLNPVVRQLSFVPLSTGSYQERTESAQIQLINTDPYLKWLVSLLRKLYLAGYSGLLSWTRPWWIDKRSLKILAFLIVGVVLIAFPLSVPMDIQKLLYWYQSTSVSGWSIQYHCNGQPRSAILRLWRRVEQSFRIPRSGYPDRRPLDLADAVTED